MANNLFDELAKAPVPPLPANFRQRIHHNLNPYLLVGQVLEVALQVLPYALGQFALAMTGCLVFSFTGKWPRNPVTNSQPPETNE